MQTRQQKLFSFYLHWIFISHITFSGGQQFPEPGSNCTISNGKEVQGICTPLTECQSGISDLQAGVNPTLCSIREKVAIVCCRTQPRISVKKCVEFTKVFKVDDGPIPLLPPIFLGNKTQEEINCGNLPNSYIVGGRDAKVDEFPHMAALGFGEEGSLIWGCGGTLISEEFVLTAAHCIDTTNLGRPKKILLGDITLGVKTGPSRMTVGISEIIKHPEYKHPSSYNDIALIRLEKKINISRSILPACLTDPERRLDKKRQLTTIGWGKLGYAENQSETLQAVNLTRFNSTSCNEYYQDLPARALKYPEGILRKQICAGDKEASKDSCQGDSGGPLTANLELRCIHYVIGVTSFGSNYCGSSTPGVYTNVQSYLDWIEDIVWSDETDENDNE